VDTRLKSKHLYVFGSYRLDAVERVLLRGAQPITLPPKDLETLLVLVERAGHIVAKEELLDRVWPGVFVEEGNLSRHVFNLRQVLGESPDGPKYIETVPKRGYRFVAEVREERTAPNEAGAPAADPIRTTAGLEVSRRLWLWPVALLAGLAVVALVAVVVCGHFWPPRHSSGAKVMLAVLPFANLSGDGHEDYFADGLTEEMIAQLGQLQPTKLGVIARTSTVQYKGTKETVAQIGRELGVGYLLEGSVRRGGERVRITAQLVQVAEQTHLWAETYERPLTDVLSIQREIAEKVTHSLSIQLLPAATRVSASPHINFESYDKYLLGLHELGQGTRESESRAIQHFQEGIVKDPNDARIYAALAGAYNAATTYYSSPVEVMPKAKEAALRAVAIDPNLAGAHVTLGYVHLFYDWDWPAADTEYRRALEINPSLPEAQLGYANYLATLGRFDEALSRVQEAYLFDPLALESRNEALWIYYFSGRMPETIAQCQKIIELEPDAGLPHAMLALAYAQMGQRAETLQAAGEAIRLANSPSVTTTTAAALARMGQSAQARQLLSKALEQAKERYVCRFLVARAYVEMGETEKALASLEQGVLQRST
jgi:TolB-like protein/DNA-binding winged helix-turn-helix (wHTH) protein/tetratricopeptide (TPR) repeat protein